MPITFACPHCDHQVVLELVTNSKGRPLFKKERPESEPMPDLEILLDNIDDSKLAPVAFDFMKSTRARFKEYGPKTFMSAKQAEFLRDIAKGKADKKKDPWDE